jgi:eukaryotic-like serine/threonine-protein kinase
VMDVDITPEGLPYIVMEFLEGNDLDVELERRDQLKPEEAADYVLQACSAMIEAHHQGIVHRDLKPANLFLAVQEDIRIIKVLDFGVSKLQSDGDAKLTSSDSVMGTALYMSPEQIRASAEVDGRSDIWSLGIILYELMAGRPPWSGTPTQLAAAIVSEDAPDLRKLCEVPAEIAAIVSKALQRDPADRFGSVKELALALAPFAPEGSAGRAVADGLQSGLGSSGSYPRVSVRPRLEESAATVARSGEGGTAPGWSQHETPKSRKRTVVVGFLGAFAAGLLVIGLIVFAWMRAQTNAANAAAERATAASSVGATAATAATAEAASPAPEGSQQVAPPPVAPQLVEPQPQPQVVAPSATASHSAAPPARTKGTNRAPVAPTPAGKPAAPDSKAAPAAPSANPLLL